MGVVALGLVDQDVAVPGGLGLVHRGVGVAQQVVGRGRVVGVEGDADAGVELELGRVDRQRVADAAQHAIGDVLRSAQALVGIGVGQVGDEQRELVAAVAG